MVIPAETNSVGGAIKQRLKNIYNNVNNRLTVSSLCVMVKLSLRIASTVKVCTRVLWTFRFVVELFCVWRFEKSKTKCQPP